MIKVLITSGGTSEYIDPVRILTNISTGKLGMLLAEAFIAENVKAKKAVYLIHHIYTKGSLSSKNPTTYYTKYEVKSALDAFAAMEHLVPGMDVVIHAMAVSDFSFKLITEKLQSNSPEDFIESMKSRIFVNPKILSNIKTWNPECYLISFKFENDISTGFLIDKAIISMNKSNSDLVIANDKEEMKRNNTHVSYFISRNILKRVDGKENIVKEILHIIENIKQ